MDAQIKKLLTELVSFAKPDIEEVFLKNAYEKMGFRALDNLIVWLLHWQKNIYDNDMAPTPSFQKDRYILSDIKQEQFQQFFEYCPELNYIYTLRPGMITFQENLSKEEINEVLDFIDKNHTIEFRRTIGKG